MLRYIHIYIYICIFFITYIQSASKVLDNVVIFAPIVDVQLSIIVKFSIFVEDLLNNKSAQVFLNRQNSFLWYKFIAHLLDLWTSENIKYNYLQYELKHWQVFYLLRAATLQSSSEDLLDCGCSCKHSMRINYFLVAASYTLREKKLSGIYINI